MHDLTAKELESLWNGGNDTRAYQKARQDYYDGKHSIVGRNETYVDGSTKSERVANFVRFGVDMYVGSLTSGNFTITDKDEASPSDGPIVYRDIADLNNLPAVDSSNLRNAMTKGYGLDCYAVVDKNIYISSCDPVDWQIVYDSDGAMVGAIYRSQISAGTYHMDELLKKDLDIMVVYSETQRITYERESGKTTGDNAGWAENARVEHNFGRVPLVEWVINETGTSYITDDLIGQVDEYNDIDSMSGDNIRYDSDGVLKIKGYSAENIKDNAQTIREYKILPLPVEGDAEFIQKHTDFARVESRLKRTREHIFSAMAVPDVESILGATGTTSGIALRLKFKPMIENANTMITHLKRGMRERIEVINHIHDIMGKPTIQDYNVVIGFSLPVNRVEEWQNIGNLDGIVSRKTMLELLSDIKDPENELDRIQREAEDAGDVTRNSGTPEQVAARVDQQIQEQVPNLTEIVSGVVDAIADAALASIVQNNKAKAAPVAEGEAQ